MFLLKYTMQCCWWGSNLQPLGLESSTQPLSYCAPSDGEWKHILPPQLCCSVYFVYLLTDSYFQDCKHLFYIFWLPSSLRINLAILHMKIECITLLMIPRKHRKPKASGPEVIKLFSCSTQLSTKFILLINVKIPTIVGILTFISMINTTSERLKARSFLTFRCFSFYEQ